MNKNYQLNIYQNDKLMGTFQTASLNPLEDIKSLIGYLQHHQDLTFKLHHLVEESRVLLQKYGSMQLLGINNVYQPCSIDSLEELKNKENID